MRLSEAIRLGAMAKPQAFQQPTRLFADYRTEQSLCALATAAYAAGMTRFFYPDIYERWPLLEAVGGTCPVCAKSGTVAEIVWCLNDRHHWTREQIAEWVALNERTESAASVDAVDPVGERVTG